MFNRATEEEKEREEEERPRMRITYYWSADRDTMNVSQSFMDDINRL